MTSLLCRREWSQCIEILLQKFLSLWQSITVTMFGCSTCVAKRATTLRYLGIELVYIRLMITSMYHAPLYRMLAHHDLHSTSPPPLAMMADFCEEATKWIEQSKENVVAIHCKAGKGRTGVMISALLLWQNHWPNAQDAMSYFGQMRLHMCSLWL